MDKTKVTSDVTTHLCPKPAEKKNCVTVKDYGELGADLQRIMNGTESLWVGRKFETLGHCKTNSSPEQRQQAASTSWLFFKLHFGR